MSRKVLIVLVSVAVLAAIGGGLLLQGLGGSEAKARALETLSEVYTVQQEYRSMMGPSSLAELTFPVAQSGPELAWIVGYRADVVGADGEKPVSQEFMCHANLDFDSERHARLLNLPVYHTDRLFTLSQGQQQIRLPQGFGIPFYTDEKFDLTTQVLNLNPDGKSYDLRHKVALDYILERDLEEPLKPLFMTSAWGLKLLEGHDGYFGIEAPMAEQEGSTCLPGEAAGPDTYEDEYARRFSGHWVVPPGREENRTLVTKILKIPYDTTVHYIAAHLHPFAVSVELRDLTTGETVHRSETEPYDDKVGLARVDYYSSEEGIPVYADHEYELISVYNNTTDEPQDSMAVMLLYLHDKQFKKQPRTLVPASQIAHVEQPPRISEDRLVLHTADGEVIIGFYPDAAPKHVERILELARQGIYDSVYFSRIDDLLIQTAFPHQRAGAALTAEQQALIKPLEAEFSDLPATNGTVLMSLHDNADPNSAQAEFFILLTNLPSIEQQYTVVGRVTGGFDTLRALSEKKVEPPYPLIEKAEVVPLSQLRAEAVKRRDAQRTQ